MMIQSHLLGAVLLGLLVARVRPMGRLDWALAIGFAVAIDVDHLLQVPAYLASNPPQSFADLHPGAIMAWGASWQGFMHTPWAFALAAPACLFWRSWIPLAFWGLHMFQDFVVATRLVGFGSPLEYAVGAAMLAAIGALVWRERVASGRARSLAGQLAATFGLAR